MFGKLNENCKIMPYKECVQRFPKLLDDRHFTQRTEDWSPKVSEVNAREKLRFQDYTDQLSCGIQYWHKQFNCTKRKSRQSGNENKPQKLSQLSKCSNCGGLLSNEFNGRSYFDTSRSCVYGKEYCDVLGPCTDCCLEEQRNAIVEKQTLDFPGLEVTPRRLVAPTLVRQMVSDCGQGNACEHADSQLARSVMEFPSISLETLRYMRREAGSRKHRRDTYCEDKKRTDKKYIEIRLPKI